MPSNFRRDRKGPSGLGMDLGARKNPSARTSLGTADTGGQVPPVDASFTLR